MFQCQGARLTDCLYDSVLGGKRNRLYVSVSRSKVTDCMLLYVSVSRSNVKCLYDSVSGGKINRLYVPVSRTKVNRWSVCFTVNEQG